MLVLHHMLRERKCVKTHNSTSKPHVTSQQGKKIDGLTFVWIICPGMRPIAYPIEKNVLKLTSSFPYKLRSSRMPETYA